MVLSECESTGSSTQGTCCFWVPKSTPKKIPLSASWWRTLEAKMLSRQTLGSIQLHTGATMPQVTSKAIPKGGLDTNLSVAVNLVQQQGQQLLQQNAVAYATTGVC